MQRLVVLLVVVVLVVTSAVAVLPQTAQANLSLAGSTSQQLLAPAASPPGSQPAPHSSFDLVAEYVFDVSNSEAAQWTMGRDGRAGQRLSYLLSRNSIKTYAVPSQVKSAIDHRQPLIWLNRNSETGPYTYTLVVIGNPEILLGLQLDRAPSLDAIMPNLPSQEQKQQAKDLGLCPRDLGAESRVPVQNLATGRAISATLQAELTTRDGAFLPVAVSHIDFQPDAETAQLCYSAPGFVLLAPSYPGWHNYQMHMVLSHNIAGPPGEGWSILCTRWDRSNWWTRLLSALYGC